MLLALLFQPGWGIQREPVSSSDKGLIRKGPCSQPAGSNSTGQNGGPEIAFLLVSESLELSVGSW